MSEDKNNSGRLQKIKQRIVKIVGFCLKACFIIFIFLCAYVLIGFPLTKDDFYNILPSIITITSVFLVFYNVNRTQLKNFENENKKFRRDARIKVADELVECFAGLDDVIREIDEHMYIGDYTDEKRDLIRQIFNEHSKKIKIILYKRKEIIEYYENLDDRRTAKSLISDINNTIYTVERKLIWLNGEGWRDKLKDIRGILVENILNHREEVVTMLYGDIFKQRTYSDLNFIEKLKHDSKHMGMLAYAFPIFIAIYALLYFKTYLLELFIK